MALLLRSLDSRTTLCRVPGRLPSMQALCDYAGYAQAISSGNYTSYLAATSPGAFGDLSKCLAASKPTWKAQRSFP